MQWWYHYHHCATTNTKLHHHVISPAATLPTSHLPLSNTNTDTTSLNQNHEQHNDTTSNAPPAMPNFATVQPLSTGPPPYHQPSLCHYRCTASSPSLQHITMLQLMRNEGNDLPPLLSSNHAPPRPCYYHCYATSVTVPKLPCGHQKIINISIQLPQSAVVIYMP